jgi:hypothetical protein
MNTGATNDVSRRRDRHFDQDWLLDKRLGLAPGDQVLD